MGLLDDLTPAQRKFVVQQRRMQILSEVRRLAALISVSLYHRICTGSFLRLVHRRHLSPTQSD